MPKKKRDRVTTNKRGARDLMQDPTPTGRSRAAKGKKVRRSASAPDRAQCTAHKANGERCRRPPVRGGERCQGHGGDAGVRKNAAKRGAVKRALDKTDKVTCTAHKRNGDRCSNPPVRGAAVCRMHGGSAPQVRAKANKRLIEMVLPALAHLRKIIDSPATSDADKLKAIQMVLNRTGYNEKHSIDIGLREPTPFDELQHTAFRIMRGVENVTGDDSPTPIEAQEHDALTSGGGGVDDEALEDFLAHRARARQQEAQTRLDNAGHDVVPGNVSQRESLDPFFRDERDRAEFARRQTEHDPDPVSRDGDAWAAYEERVREGVERPHGRRP